ncbi:Ig-like domain-containing protein [Paraliomyxa miuraensis]|uniref:Ig-like domain-containing protein n=1 Tax=Paraliomyxa miuraensis TaxID=376150 RepID=UPI00225A4609|nr:Ig-like domain-containing protein [Paraliomyxa miuraensis]MCX4246706.1 hypothetical protein [Paraliomyxa miuraensis]
MGSDHYVIRGVNTEAVHLNADGSSFSATNLEVMGPAPCGEGTSEATGVLRLVAEVAAGPTREPPSITINVPSEVSCPSDVELDATATDPDGDLDSVRWFVDDVLISASTTDLEFTTSHELRAVARDSRGAATTAVKSVNCL